MNALVSAATLAPSISASTMNSSPCFLTEPFAASWSRACWIVRAVRAVNACLEFEFHLGRRFITAASWIVVSKLRGRAAKFAITPSQTRSSQTKVGSRRGKSLLKCASIIGFQLAIEN